MKKLLIAAAVFVILIVGALATIPMFYDINKKARPIILQAIQDSMDVDAQLGKLSLSLFGGIKIGVESLTLSGKTTHATLLHLQNAEIVLPYSSLLAGNIGVTIKASQPEINVTRYEDGSINILKLLKNQNTQATSEANESKGSNAGAALASRLKISIDITNASMKFKDMQSKIDYQIQDLDLMAQNIGVNQEMKIHLATNASVDNKKDILLDGRIKLDGKTKINMNAQGFKAAELDLICDLKDLKIKYGEMINKPKGVDLNFTTKLSATTSFVHFESARLGAGNFFVDAKGDIENFKAPQFNLEVTTNQIELSQWKDIVGMVSDYDLKGSVQAHLKISGTSQNPKLDGQVKVQDAQLKTASMIAPITKINLTADMAGDTIKISQAGMNIGGGEISATGTISKLSSPIINLKISSAGINVNKIMPASNAKAEVSANGKNEALPTLAQSMAVPIAMIKSNEFLKKSDINLIADIKKINYASYDIEDLKTELVAKNLNFIFKNTSLKIFKGVVKPSLQVNLASLKPVYKFNAEISKVDINAAIVSKAKDLDKSLTGEATGKINISGVGLEDSDLKKTAKGSAQFDIKNGTWSGVAALKNIGSKLSGVPKIGEAISKLNIGDKFTTLTMTAVIQNGAIDITKCKADMEKTKASIEALGTISFDKQLNLRGDLLAPLGSVPKDLKASDGRAKIPFEMRGTANSPEVDWNKTLGVVAKAYAKDEGKKLLNKEVDQLKNKLLKRFHF